MNSVTSGKVLGGANKVIDTNKSKVPCTRHLEILVLTKKRWIPGSVSTSWTSFLNLHLEQSILKVLQLENPRFEALPVLLSHLTGDKPF